MTVVYVWVIVAFGGFTSSYNTVHKMGGPDAPQFAVESDCVKHLPKVRQHMDRGASVECVKTPLVVPVFTNSTGSQPKK